MLAYRWHWALCVGLWMGCDSGPRHAADDDDGGSVSGAGGSAGAAGAGGSETTEWGAVVEWQIELDSLAQIARAAGPDGEIYLDDASYSPAWHLDRIDADGKASWPIDYAPPEATYAGRTAVGSDGSLVLVGAEGFGWHTAKLEPNGSVAWVRVLGTSENGRAEGASIAPNGTITVVGSATMYSDCMITRYLQSGTALDEVWLQTLEGSMFCHYVVSDDERVYVPSGATSGGGTLHVFDGKSGVEIAATPLPGASMGAEVGLLTLVPGGGVLVGAHEQSTRHLWLVDPEGAILWEDHLADAQGRVAARADGTLVASVIAPPLGERTVTGELAIRWYRREADALVEAGSASLGPVEDPVVATVVPLPDGSFAVEWATNVKSPTAARYWLARVRPEAP